MVVRIWDEPSRVLSDQDVTATLPRFVGTTHATTLPRTYVLHSLADPEGARYTDPLAETVWRIRLQSEMWPLMHLKLNWDTYGGRPVTGHAVQRAEQFVLPLVMQGVAPPSFTPSPDGGLLLEWHQPSFEVLVRWPADESGGDAPTAMIADDHSGEVWEDQLDAMTPRLASALSRFVAPPAS